MALKLIAISSLLALSALPATSASQDFYGYPCTQDCSGHEAGYAWAERKDITDPDDCGGNSQSFIEGCRAYAEEQQDEQADDDCDEDDPEDCEG